MHPSEANGQSNSALSVLGHIRAVGLANQLNISLRAYYKIETGKTQLTINRLNEISKILEVPAIEILQFNPEIFFFKP
jgi:transcriptional regulator with XRE-family HTH domain